MTLNISSSLISISIIFLFIVNPDILPGCWLKLNPDQFLSFQTHPRGIFDGPACGASSLYEASSLRGHGAMYYLLHCQVPSRATCQVPSRVRIIHEVVAGENWGWGWMRWIRKLPFQVYILQSEPHVWVWGLGSGVWVAWYRGVSWTCSNKAAWAAKIKIKSRALSTIWKRIIYILCIRCILV